MCDDNDENPVAQLKQRCHHALERIRKALDKQG